MEANFDTPGSVCAVVLMKDNSTTKPLLATSFGGRERHSLDDGSVEHLSGEGQAIAQPMCMLT